MPVAHIFLTSMPIMIGGREARLPCMSTLVDDGKNLMLFDTGLNGGTELINAISRLGFTSDDITHVFNTHFHGDHAGGNVLFPDTMKFASLREYHFSRTWLRGFADAGDRVSYMRGYYPYLTDEIIRERSTILSENLTDIPDYWWNDEMEDKGYIWLEDASLPSGVLPIKTPGHTPHHMSYIVKGLKTDLIIAGDALPRRNAMSIGDDIKIDFFDEPHIDLDAYKKSRSNLLSYPAIIVPGHDRPFTTSNIGIRAGKRVKF